jgi:branched-chain amino acid transport system ATP-binding protein
MSAVLAAKGLRAGYGQLEVVRDLDLAIEAGQVVALLGPNGAGKTTTLLTLAGMLAPLGGEVQWLGTATRAPLHVRARAGLGLVTERRAVFPGLTVTENLRVSRCSADRAFELFPELEAHATRKLSDLSGGQQQMVALARVLARPIRLLLADELSLGLAPLIADRLLRAVRAAADSGVGVLLVEQHVHKAIAIADQIALMRRGTVQISGSAAEIASRMEEVQAFYLSSAHEPITSPREQE